MNEVKIYDRTQMMKEANENEQQVSYADTLKSTLQEEFPLLGEVTEGLVEEPLYLMNAHADEDGVVVPCALPDSMVKQLPQMICEPLSLYDDADIRTMLLAAMLPTLGSAMSNVRVRHGRRLYTLGMMNVCVGPSASGKGSVGDVASLVNGINDIVCAESAQAIADFRKRHNRYTRLNKQLDRAAKGDVAQLVDINDIADEADEPEMPLRRMHKLPSKTTAANYYRLLFANGDNISYLYVPELAELNAANRSAYGDFAYMLLAAQNEESLHTARKTDDEDFLVEHTRLALVATGTDSSVRAFIPNLEDGLSTRFIYHNLPAKGVVRDEMDEAMADAMNDVFDYRRRQLTEIWTELRRFDGMPDEELPRLMLSEGQRTYINEYYRQLVTFISLTQSDKDLRAPILRSRLNLYRILMIVAVLRRHEATGGAEGLFDVRHFEVADADLRWGLAYIFYCTMQAASLYDRLRREEREEAPKATRISPLAFLQMLPNSFTRSVAESAGEEMGLKKRSVTYHLNTLCSKGLIVRIQHGVYRKVKRQARKNSQAT